MYFRHSEEIRRDFPELVAGVLFAEGVTGAASVDARVARLAAVAAARLANRSEAELPEIQAWRRAFSRMGLKPTQYRCAAESLLRRFKKEGALPQIHPLVDLCNAVSLAFAIPVAAFDASKVSGFLEVRRATGAESYLGFSGEVERPDAGEVVFADAAGMAHARRWSHRQSGYSAVRGGTTAVLVVAEAMHASAPADVERLVATVADEVRAVWSVSPEAAILGRSSPTFEW